MSTKAARPALLIAALLIVWGPPALRVSGRELDTALVNPLAFDAAALLQVGAWVFAGALALLLGLSHLARQTGFFSALLADRPLRWYGLYGLLGFASVSYSSSPLYTAYFSLQIIVGILILGLLEWHWHARRGSRAMQVLFVVYGLQAAAIALFYFVRREWVAPFGSGEGSEPVRITGGVFGDYGSSGLLCGLFFLTVSLFARKTVYRLLAVVLYAVCWWLIVLSQTRATMAAGVVFLLIMLHANPRARIQAAVISVGVAIAIFGLLPTLVPEIVSRATRRGEGIETLSGRTEAFAYLLERWQESPLVGYGFAAGTRNLLFDFVQRGHLNIGAGHDVLSTVLVDLGLVGFLFLFAAFAAAWIACVRLYLASRGNREPTIYAHQVACVLAYVTLHGIVDKSFAGPSTKFIVVLVAIWSLRQRLDASRSLSPYGPTQHDSTPVAAAAGSTT